MQSTIIITPELHDEIERLAAMPSQAVTLRALYEVARAGDDDATLRYAQFLHREMPIRLAVKVRQLEQIPDGMANNRSIQTVRNWYVQSFREFQQHPLPTDAATEASFTRMIAAITDRHKNQVAVMARGIRAYMEQTGQHVASDQLQAFLDSFLLSRIGIRVLLGHHVALHQEREGWYGIIGAQTSPREVAEEAAANAGAICRRTYGDPPPVRILGRTNLRFKYIPEHLHLMLFELLKNSFRAVLQNHGKVATKLPPIDIVIAGGAEDVSIKIDDQGGGMCRRTTDKIMRYGFTTAESVEFDDGRLEHDVLAGLGYGLPLCRLYARYFGGDLQIVSLDGYGTDAFLHLSRLGNLHETVL
jgi:pyruvate dehydrogenase kinase 2/3/4